VAVTEDLTVVSLQSTVVSGQIENGVVLFLGVLGFSVFSAAKQPNNSFTKNENEAALAPSLQVQLLATGC
jgi:hypothetical protein